MWPHVHWLDAGSDLRQICSLWPLKDSHKDYTRLPSCEKSLCSNLGRRLLWSLSFKKSSLPKSTTLWPPLLWPPPFLLQIIKISMILCNGGIRHFYMVVMNLDTPVTLFQLTGAKLMNSLNITTLVLKTIRWLPIALYLKDRPWPRSQTACCQVACLSFCKRFFSFPSVTSEEMKG